MCFLTSVVFADSPAPPQSYCVTTRNGKYLFVMKAPQPYRQYEVAPRDGMSLTKFPKSGLYTNDVSARLLWDVDWYGWGVEVSSDGHHLARWGPWPDLGHYDELALAFYRDGKELKRYVVKDLVASPSSLPQTVSHYQWRGFDDDKGLLTVQVLGSREYAFDITTGLEAVTRRDPFQKPPGPPGSETNSLILTGIILGPKKSRLALINNSDVSVRIGESAVVTTKEGKVNIRCEEIEKDYVVVTVIEVGRWERRELRVQNNPVIR